MRGTCAVGKPVTFTLTGGQVHDNTQVSALISRGAIRRIGRGRLRPAKMKSGVSPASIARHTGNVTSSSA